MVTSSLPGSIPDDRGRSSTTGLESVPVDTDRLALRRLFAHSGTNPLFLHQRSILPPLCSSSEKTERGELCLSDVYLSGCIRALRGGRP